MTSEAHFRKLERMYAAAACNEYYEPRLTIREGASRISLEVQPKYFHAAGAVHGSVYFKLLDDACFFAAASLLTTHCVLTATFDVQFFRPVASGVLVAEGAVSHRTQRLFFAEATLVDGDGEKIARGSGSFAKSRIELTAELGYG